MGQRSAFVHLFTIGAVALLVAAGPAAAVDVDECGQWVPSGEVGNLVADLNCTEANTVERCAVDFSRLCAEGCPGSLGCLRAAVFMGSPRSGSGGVLVGAGRVRLNLNGHTVAGDGQFSGAHCAGRNCIVDGPGVISNFFHGIGVPAQQAVLRATGVEVRDSAYSAIIDPRLAKLEDVTIENCGEIGVWARRVSVRNVSVSGCASAGVFAQRLTGTGLTLDGNHRGIDGDSVRLRELQLTNSVDVGLIGDRVSLRDSVLSDNDAGGGGIDILSHRRPKLRATTCNLAEECDTTTSSCAPSGLAWGVCQ